MLSFDSDALPAPSGHLAQAGHHIQIQTKEKTHQERATNHVKLMVTGLETARVVSEFMTVSVLASPYKSVRVLKDIDYLTPYTLCVNKPFLDKPCCHYQRWMGEIRGFVLCTNFKTTFASTWSWNIQQGYVAWKDSVMKAAGYLIIPRNAMAVITACKWKVCINVCITVEENILPLRGYILREIVF